MSYIGSETICFYLEELKGSKRILDIIENERPQRMKKMIKCLNMTDGVKKERRHKLHNKNPQDIFLKE